MSSVGQIIKNTMTGWAAKAIQLGIAMVMVPFLVKAIGKEGYGLIGLFSVFTALSLVADLGLRSALGRELAEKVALEDKQGFRELSITAMVLYLGIACVLVVLIWIFSPWLVTLFKVSENLHEDAVLLFRIYGCSTTIISFVTPVFNSGLTSFMRFDINNVIQTSVLTVSSLLIFLLISVWKDQALYVWVFVMLFGGVVSLAVSFIAYKAVCYQGVLNLKSVNLNNLRSLFSLGGKMYAVQMAQTLSDKADPFILSSFLGPIGVALYQPAARLSQMLNPIVMTLTEQLYPLTTKFHATGNKESMGRVLCEGTKYTLLLGSLFSAGIFVFSEPFVRLWLYDSLGNDYIVVVRVMKMYAIIDLLSYASGTQWPILLGMKKLTFLTYLLIATAVLNIALSIYFVGYTSVGVIGVLFGTLISKVIRILILNVYIIKLMRLNVFEYIFRAFARPAICLLITGIAGFVLRARFLCQTWTILFLIVGLTVAFWALSCLVFGFSKSEFDELRSVSKGWTRGG